MDFRDLVQKRRSIRKFSDKELSPEDVQTILRAGLMSPTSKSSRAWHFIVIDDKNMLEKMSQCKNAGADFVKDAPLAVVVLMDTELTDVWVEDASIAAVTMQYQASDLAAAGHKYVCEEEKTKECWPTTCSACCFNILPHGRLSASSPSVILP